jgi:hypothetical protein
LDTTRCFSTNTPTKIRLRADINRKLTNPANGSIECFTAAVELSLCAERSAEVEGRNRNGKGEGREGLWTIILVSKIDLMVVFEFILQIVIKAVNTTSLLSTEKMHLEV